MGKKGGYWAYSELKSYGVPRKPTPIAPIFRGKKRDSIIQQVMDVLDDWRASAFENEAVVVAGLRSALCLRGFSWGQSNQEALMLTGEALRRNGAVRPSWEQGQREYVVPREKCAWCELDIPEEDRQGERNPVYCSPTCARSALRHRYESESWRSHQKGAAASRLIARHGHELRSCAVCQRSFHLSRRGSSEKYCSQPCAAIGRRKIPDKFCAGCGQVFRSEVGDAAAKFCSMACYDQSRRTASIEKTCLDCGKPFLAKTERGKFCCSQCQTRYMRRRSKNPSLPSFVKPMKLVAMTCVICGAGFESKSRRRMTCGDACFRLYDKAKRRNDAIIPLLAPIFDGWFKRVA